MQTPERRPNRFNIVLVAPAGNVHYQAFQEIAETLRFGLESLGYAARVAIDEFDPAATNIVLGAHLLDAQRAAALPERTILYNLEQVAGDTPVMKPPYVDCVLRCTTWDYSRRNVAQWRRYCPRAEVLHVPVGYVPQLTRIAPAGEDIDVLFYGSLNDRRRRILDELKRAGLKVTAVFGVYGAQRDALIARAKLALNMHFYDAKIFEIPRVSYLLANRKAVVAEVDAQTEIDDELRAAVAGVPYEKLAEKCIELVRDDSARERLAQTGYAIFSQRAEADILARALAASNGGGRPASGANAPQTGEPPRAEPMNPADPADPPPLPRKLNAGSGKSWNFECLNLDLDPLWQPDWIADLNQPLPPAEPVDLGRFGRRVVPADYFDEIVVNDVLEHLPNLVVAMTSFLRLLREGGVLAVQVPYDLSLGAWQDPTHVRAMNERSWLYFTEWHWYLGWREYRFELVEQGFIASAHGQALAARGAKIEELLRTPRAIDAMRVKLKKIRLSPAEKQRAERRWL